MSKSARNELVMAIARRYRESGRNEKMKILDEFVAVTGYHRKHARFCCVCALEAQYHPGATAEGLCGQCVERVDI